MRWCVWRSRVDMRMPCACRCCWYGSGASARCRARVLHCVGIARARAMGKKIICGCISLKHVGDASSCIGVASLRAGHSSAATRCFLAVMVASVFFIAVDKNDVEPTSCFLAGFIVYARPFSPTEGSHGTFNPFSVR